MLRLSLIAYCVGTLFLGLSYWDILYQLIFIAVLVKQFALREMEQKLSRVDAVAVSTNNLPGASRRQHAVVKTGHSRDLR